MSVIKQESLHGQRGVKRAREVDTNLTDELVYCIDKARLAQRYLGIRPQPLPTGDGTDLPVSNSSASSFPPYKAEQSVVFVAFQCESKGRIEKPQAGQRERIHNVKISIVDSAVRRMKKRGRAAAECRIALGRVGEGWHWENAVLHEHPTQMSRFQRHEAVEKKMLDILNKASMNGERNVVLVGHNLPYVSACLSETGLDPAVLPYVIGTLDTQDLQIAMNYYRMEEHYQTSDDDVMKRDFKPPMEGDVLDKLLELAAVSLKARGQDDDENLINGGDSHYLNNHLESNFFTVEDQERLLQETKAINVSGRKSWW